MNDELKWTITSTEQKKRSLAALFILAPIIILYYLSSLGGHLTFKGFLLEFLFIALVFILIYFALSRKTYNERTYFLGTDRILISKGNKSKEYYWNNFDYFFSSRKWKKSEFYPKQRMVMGDSYYLRKKPNGFTSKLYKTFLVIYSEPENDEDVYQFLASRLPTKASVRDEMGLIVYEFK